MSRVLANSLARGGVNLRLALLDCQVRTFTLSPSVSGGARPASMPSFAPGVWAVLVVNLWLTFETASLFASGRNEQFRFVFVEYMTEVSGGQSRGNHG